MAGLKINFEKTKVTINFMVINYINIDDNIVKHV